MSASLVGSWLGTITVPGSAATAYTVEFATGGSPGEGHYILTGSHSAYGQSQQFHGAAVGEQVTFIDGESVCIGRVSGDRIAGTVHNEGSLVVGAFDVTRRVERAPPAAAVAPAPAVVDAAAAAAQTEAAPAAPEDAVAAIKADDVAALTAFLAADPALLSRLVSSSGSGGLRGGDGSMGNVINGLLLHVAAVNLKPATFAFLLERMVAAGAHLDTRAARVLLGQGCIKDNLVSPTVLHVLAYFMRRERDMAAGSPGGAYVERERLPQARVLAEALLAQDADRTLVAGCCSLQGTRFMEGCVFDAVEGLVDAPPGVKPPAAATAAK